MCEPLGELIRRERDAVSSARVYQAMTVRAQHDQVLEGSVYFNARPARERIEVVDIEDVRAGSIQE